MVEWLSTGNNRYSSFNNEDWEAVNEPNATSITHSLDTRRFRFEKSIAAKSLTGKNGEFLELVKNHSIGVGSRDLPFGVIPPSSRTRFAMELSDTYTVNTDILNKISRTDVPLIVCMVKGFKPKGDDNRPDRGILPLIAMLSSEDTEIMTFIYGPVIKNNYAMLCNNPNDLARRSGFWRVFMSLSDYFVLDVPLLPPSYGHIEKIIDNTQIKRSYTNQRPRGSFTREKIPVTPNSYHEDDVDTIIHYIFKHIASTDCFEGMCNPPGGDWSGMSVVLGDTEYRWLSLPRVSTDKRPDHVVELFGITEKPVLLVIESKDRKTDLEPNVGERLKGYIKYLFSFTASVEKKLPGEWRISSKDVQSEHFNLVSAGAYISDESDTPSDLFIHCNCDMIFALYPNESIGKWNFRIFTNTPLAARIREFVISSINQAGETVLNIL